MEFLGFLRGLNICERRSRLRKITLRLTFLLDVSSKVVLIFNLVIEVAILLPCSHCAS